MTDAASIRKPYSAGRMFLIALVFIGAAPLFWQRVEVSAGEVAEARENADLYHYVYPAYEYGFGRLRAGELPQWNPRQHCGTAFLADPRIGLFQPLNAVFLVLPTGRALAVHAFVSLALMGIFFAMLARSLGVGYAPALIGALAYAFSGASAAAMSRPALAGALAWFPFACWAVHDFARRGRPGSAVLAGLGLAALVLSGAPALVATLVVFLAAFAAVAATAPKGGRPAKAGRFAAGLLLALFLGVAVSAVQWVPTVAWLTGGGVFDPGFWNVHAAAHVPANLKDLLLQLPAAHAGTLPRLAYVGIATLLLAPAAFAHKPLRRYAAFFGAVAVASFGALLVDPAVLPGGFPPQAFAYPGVLSMAALAAIGADRLFSLRREGVSPGPWAAAAIVLVAGVVLFALFTGQVRGYVIAFVAVLAPFLALRRGWAAGAAGVLMSALLFIDLISASVNSFTHPFQNAPQCYARYSAAISTALERAGGGRAVVSASPSNVGLSPNLGMVTGLRMAGGHDLPQTAAQRAWSGRAFPAGDGEQAGSARLLDFVATRVPIATNDRVLPPDSEDWQPILAQGDLRVFVNQGALPRAYWVPRCRVAEGTEAALDLMADPGFDSSRLCVVDAAAAGGNAPLPVAAEGDDLSGAPTWRDATCAVEDVSPERVKMVVDAPAPGIAVLSDSFAPAWEATLDGVPCRILKVNAAFRGIAVPAGRHELAYGYRPLSFELARALSVATLALVAALGAVGLYREVERRVDEG